MNICFISSYSSTNQGGATLSMFNVANELARRGNRILVVLNSNANLDKIYMERNVTCIISPFYSMRINMKEKDNLTNIKFLLKYYMNFFCLIRIFFRLKDEKIDIIHINGLNNGIGAYLARLLKVPYVWHIRQLLEEDLSQTIFRKHKLWKLVRQSNRVIAISKVVQEKFEKEIGRDIEVIYNGVPIEKYYLNNTILATQKKIKILLAGRIDEGKGQLDAVKAVNKLISEGVQIELIIVGSIEDKKYATKIERFIDENGLNDNVHMIQHEPDLSQLRKMCDIGIICSKKEAFGRVTIENQLSGLVVIGANSGGTKEIIKNNLTGLLYREGSVDDLASKIKYVYFNRQEAQRIALDGQKYAVENYSISNVVDQIYQIYNQIKFRG